MIAGKSSKEGKLKVTLDLDLWSIHHIEEVNEMFRAQFKITMTWKDSRLTYLNLQKNSYMNRVSHEEASDIWIPNVMFLNTESLFEFHVSLRGFP